LLLNLLIFLLSHCESETFRKLVVVVHLK
jgi:hypothetical protein